MHLLYIADTFWSGLGPLFSFISSLTHYLSDSSCQPGLCFLQSSFPICLSIVPSMKCAVWVSLGVFVFMFMYVWEPAERQITLCNKANEDLGFLFSFPSSVFLCPPSLSIFVSSLLPFPSLSVSTQQWLAFFSLHHIPLPLALSLCPSRWIVH